MTTSQKILPQQVLFLKEILEGEEIPPAKLAYFRRRLRNHLYDVIIGAFLEQEEKGLTRADISRRINRRPAQITRWLGTPGNWTLETISDLALAVAKAEIKVELFPLENRLKIEEEVSKADSSPSEDIPERGDNHSTFIERSVENTIEALHSSEPQADALRPSGAMTGTRWATKNQKASPKIAA